MTSSTKPPRKNANRLPLRLFALAVALIAIFFMQCMLTAKRDSLNWDESQHLYSGWLSWKHADFGFNPEVPPLIKMWCAIPLLHRQIQQPAYINTHFKLEGFALGQKFMAINGIDRTLIPARFMASLLSVMLAILLFIAAREMFGAAPALFALALFTFDPNFLAHDAYVTTDIGAALTTLLAIYAFYRFTKRPTASRMLLLAIAVGLGLIAKFTGVLIVPILVLIAAAETWRSRTPSSSNPTTCLRPPDACCPVHCYRIRTSLHLGHLRLSLSGPPSRSRVEPFRSIVFAGVELAPQPQRNELRRSTSSAA